MNSDLGVTPRVGDEPAEPVTSLGGRALSWVADCPHCMRTIHFAASATEVPRFASLGNLTQHSAGGDEPRDEEAAFQRALAALPANQQQTIQSAAERGESLTRDFHRFGWLAGRSEGMRATPEPPTGSSTDTLCGALSILTERRGKSDKEFGALLSKLPRFDLAWPPNVQDAWRRCFARMLELATEIDTLRAAASLPIDGRSGPPSTSEPDNAKDSSMKGSA